MPFDSLLADLFTPPFGEMQGIARELWTFVPEAGVVWTNNWQSGSPNWHTIALPADADGTSAGHGFPVANAQYFRHLLNVARDGQLAVLSGKKSASANTGYWTLDNIAAIRAAPATAPVWTLIAEAGNATSTGVTTISGLPLRWLGTLTSPVTRINGSTLYMRGNLYDGSNRQNYLVWTAAAGWTSTLSDADGDPIYPVNAGIYLNGTGAAGAAKQLRDGLTNAAIGPGFTSVNFAGIAALCRRDDNLSKVFVIYKKSTDSHFYIRECVGGVDVYDLGTTISNIILVSISGAYHGDQVYVVDEDGRGFLSNDGVSFSLLDTWAGLAATTNGGWLHDTLLTGGGDLIWCRWNVAFGAAPLRLYTRAGVTLDLTGDWWSLAGMTASAKSLYNLQVVYSP